MLLAYGADPNTADGRGRTPLDYAAAQDATAVTAILVQHGGRRSGRSDRRGYEPQAAWLRTYQTAMTLSGTPSSQAAM